MAGSTITLDLCGLTCPLPVLHTRRALRRVAMGDRLVVTTTDPLAEIDLPHFVRGAGHQLERAGTVDGITTFVIVKGSSRPEPGLSPV